MFLIEDEFTAAMVRQSGQGGAPAISAEAIEQACRQACQHIAPTWPLDQSIAVNPHWKRIHLPLQTVAARMAVLAGIQVYPTRDYLRHAWQSGRVTQQDLQAAIAQTGQRHAPDDYVQALEQPLRINTLPLLIDVLDNDEQRFQRLSWRDAITHQVSQTCAAYFDQDQAMWQPQRADSLYGFWRDTLMHDHGIGTLMGLPNIHAYLDYLPPTRQQAERWVVNMLGLPVDVLADYFEAILLTVNGWASWCAYLDWQAGLQGASDQSLRDLLAIRLAWGVIVMQCKGYSASHTAIAAIRQSWQSAAAQIRQAETALQVEAVWQQALDIGYQRPLLAQLQAGLPQPAPQAAPAPLLQAAFCIDVRSEPMRRALEAVSPAINTLGVAGFFGLPVAYQPLASAQARPQLPGLLAPQQRLVDQVLDPTASDAVQAVDALTQQVANKRSTRFMFKAQLARLSAYPGAAFSLVETAGPLFIKPLLAMVRPGQGARVGVEHASLPKKYRALTRPVMADLTPEVQASLCAGILKGMGFKPPYAPLVMLVGHASQSANNAQASSLDCGACCGQSGEANTRALARMLNHDEVRTALITHGITLPAETVFVAALHNTTTQEIQGFDLDLLDAPHRAHWQTVLPWLQQAGDAVRRQQQTAREGQVQPSEVSAYHTLFQRFVQRANDAAQTRPEWGLANNAAFIMAPRARTQHLNLQGRSFLHEYDAAQDADGSVLEQLMTAPMLVTHWINWQYHASTCEPERLGSGNKLLHNVVGGRIGVFEGNGGDLRIGLSRQSLHDGQRWMHEPVRLTVFIVASRERVQQIVDKHLIVKQLIANGWLHLWCEEEGKRWQYQPDPALAMTLHWQSLTD